MINTNELKGIIVKNGYSQRQVAKKLGLSENTFYRKMKKGIFNSDEMGALIDTLNITEPQNIFFCKK